MAWLKTVAAGLLALGAVHALAQERMPPLPPGPAAQPGKTVVFVASDFRNGGVMGVYRGLEEAAQKLGWKIRVEDGMGQHAVQAKMLARAIEGRPHGIVLGGFDPDEFGDLLDHARQGGIVLLGWHAAKDPGPTRHLFANISTTPVDVAVQASDFVLRDAKARRRPVGVVIFNDSQFAVANAKTEAMRRTIQECRAYADCRVLAVENVPISEAASAMPARVAALLAKFGAAWTYSLAINDVYFDEINYPLKLAGRTDIANVSAGDGSSKALGRIAAGVSQQVATVAEPLRMQGYQLADEFNRAFAGVPPSGIQSRPILVTPELLKSTGNRGIEAGLGFEAAYAALWSGSR
ncbi:MAG: substrate-binding domain-containing protein [Burkholderiales bacterium]